MNGMTDLTAEQFWTDGADAPVARLRLSKAEMDVMAAQAGEAADFLKVLGHDGRLMILCHLLSGEKSVTELEQLLSSRQAAVSQQLARLRLEGVVTPRREGKQIFYRLTDPRVREAIALVYRLFCEAQGGR